MKVYINGNEATSEDIMELERRLKLGIEHETAKCCRGSIYIKTI